MKYLLDTNAVIAALNGRPRLIDELNALPPSDELLLSVIVFAELRYGALCSSRRDENLARVESLISVFEFVDVSWSVAARFADIKADLRRRGIAKSDADLLIAATALEEKAVLVTNDHAMLDGSIPDLIYRDWLAEPPVPNGSKPVPS